MAYRFEKIADSNLTDLKIIYKTVLEKI